MQKFLSYHQKIKTIAAKVLNTTNAEKNNEKPIKNQLDQLLSAPILWETKFYISKPYKPFKMIQIYKKVDLKD